MSNYTTGIALDISFLKMDTFSYQEFMQHLSEFPSASQKCTDAQLDELAAKEDRPDLKLYTMQVKNVLDILGCNSTWACRYNAQRFPQFYLEAEMSLGLENRPCPHVAGPDATIGVCRLVYANHYVPKWETHEGKSSWVFKPERIAVGGKM